jgi:hypothetical protein
MAVHGIAQRWLTVQKRREDARALRKSAIGRTRPVASLRETEQASLIDFRTKCFGVRCVFASLLLLLDVSRLVHSEIVGYFDPVGLE